jgi:hypothetical protein
MEKRFTFIGTLTEIYDKVNELNKQGKNATVYYGPFKRDCTVGPNHPEGIDAFVLTPRMVYEALILQMKE